jgi:AhpD family alkylhydroperoxidase
VRRKDRRAGIVTCKLLGYEYGTPNLSPKASLTVTSWVLHFADIASPRTILNLKRNPAVEINVADICELCVRSVHAQGPCAIKLRIHHRQQGIVMSERVNIGKSAPALYQAVAGLDKLASQAAAAAGMTEGFTHLLRLRASQINQCAFCVRLHTRDALASGAAIDVVSVLPAWRETEYFSDKERASLELVEAITLISDGQVPDAVYERAAASLSREEISAVEWLAVVINAWNRVAISGRYPVRP